MTAVGADGPVERRIQSHGMITCTTRYGPVRALYVPGVSPQFTFRGWRHVGTDHQLVIMADDIDAAITELEDGIAHGDVVEMKG